MSFNTVLKSSVTLKGERGDVLIIPLEDLKLLFEIMQKMFQS